MAAELQETLTAFTNELSPAERDSISQSGKTLAEDVIQFTRDVDSRDSKSKSRALGRRFRPVLESVQQFATVVDAFMQGGPALAAVLWGGIRFFIILLSNFTEYYEKISDLFLKIGNLCPRIESFRKVFPRSESLQEASCAFYATIVGFCHKTLRFLRSPSLKQLAKAAWKPFKNEFRDIEETLRAQQDEIDVEFKLASEQEAQAERLEAHAERQRACIYRSQANQHRFYEMGQWDRMNLRLDAWDRRAEREALLDRLCSHDYSSEFLRLREKRGGDDTSAQWFFDLKQFQKWQDPAAGGELLWCHGIPGSGKSVLATSVLDHLFETRRHDAYILYFFCTFASKDSLELRTILCSLAKQILQIAQDSLPPHLVDKLTNMYKSPNRLPGLREVEPFLADLLSIPKLGYIVIDGVDECALEVREGLLVTLARLRANRPNINFFLSSRTDLDLMRVHRNALEVNLDLVETRSDIQRFIDQRLAKKLKSKETILLHDEELVNEVKSALMEHARGMFLWVDLQINDICRQLNKSDVRKLLKSLPRDLDKTFERILKRIIEERLAPVAVKIFKWLSCARRPLTLDELAEAVALETTDQHYRDMQERVPQDKMKMIHHCGNLVVLRETDDTVHFAHFTVKEYLDKKSLKIQQSSDLSLFLLDMQGVDQEIGIACMAYLSFSDFQRQIAVRQGISAKAAISRVGTSLKSEVSSVVAVGQSIGWVWQAVSYAYSLAWGVGGHSGKTFELLVEEPKLVERLVKQFLLLQYVSENWMYHCNDIPAGTKIEEMFKSLVFGPGPPFQYLPWGNIGALGRPGMEHPHVKIFRWAILHEHVELILCLLRDSSPSYKRTLWSARFIIGEDEDQRSNASATDQMCEMRSLKLMSESGLHDYWFREDSRAANGRIDEQKVADYFLNALATKDYAFAEELRKNFHIPVPRQREKLKVDTFLELLTANESWSGLFGELYAMRSAAVPPKMNVDRELERLAVSLLEKAVKLVDPRAVKRLLHDMSYRMYSHYNEGHLDYALDILASQVQWEVQRRELELGKILVDAGADIGTQLSRTFRPSLQMPREVLFGGTATSEYIPRVQFLFLFATTSQKSTALKEVFENFLFSGPEISKLLENFARSELHHILFDLLEKISTRMAETEIKNLPSDSRQMIEMIFQASGGVNSINENGLASVRQAIQWDVSEDVVCCLLKAGGDETPVLEFLNRASNWHVFKKYFGAGLLLRDRPGDFENGQRFLHKAVDVWRRTALAEDVVGSGGSTRSANFEAMDGQYFGGQERELPQSSLDARDSMGRTPLLYAIDLALGSRFQEAISPNNVDSHLTQALIQSGSSLDAPDNHGRTARGVLEQYEKGSYDNSHLASALLRDVVIEDHEEDEYFVEVPEDNDDIMTFEMN